jgi:hypothetical protein
MDNTIYKLGRHLFLSQLEKAETFVRRNTISENIFMKNRKFQRWFKIWSTYLPVLFNLLLLWGRRIRIQKACPWPEDRKHDKKIVYMYFVSFFFCVVLQMGKIHTVDENLSLVVEKFSIQSKNIWICRHNPFQRFAICHLRIQFFWGFKTFTNLQKNLFTNIGLKTLPKKFLLKIYVAGFSFLWKVANWCHKNLWICS